MRISKGRHEIVLLLKAYAVIAADAINETSETTATNEMRGRR
jgi:hypothetical protein